MSSNFNLVQDILIPVVGSLMVCLSAGVLFFLRRVLQKVDDIGVVVFQNLPTYQAKVDTMSDQISELKVDIYRISGDFKEVSKLQERIAVLEYADRQRKVLNDH